MLKNFHLELFRKYCGNSAQVTANFEDAELQANRHGWKILEERVYALPCGDGRTNMGRCPFRSETEG